MSGVLEDGLTERERTFAAHYFKTLGKRPGLSVIFAGYSSHLAGKHASVILRRPKVKAYLKSLWDEAESPIVMSVRERKEKLSLIARGMVGNCLDENGEIDLEAIRNMPAVKEVTIDEYTVGVKNPVKHRNIKVKLLNPVESIHELNLMGKQLRTNEGVTQDNRVINNYFTDGSVLEKLEQIGDRTRKLIGGRKEVGDAEEKQE